MTVGRRERLACGWPAGRSFVNPCAPRPPSRTARCACGCRASGRRGAHAPWQCRLPHRARAGCRSPSCAARGAATPLPRVARGCERCAVCRRTMARLTMESCRGYSEIRTAPSSRQTILMRRGLLPLPRSIPVKVLRRGPRIYVVQTSSFALATLCFTSIESMRNSLLLKRR